MDRTLIDGDTCSRTRASYVCVIPVLTAGDNRSNQFTVLAPAGAAIGSVTTFPVRIDTAPGVVDEHPADNATQVRFRDVGTRTVRIAVTQTASRVAARRGSVTSSSSPWRPWRSAPD